MTALQLVKSFTIEKIFSLNIIRILSFTFLTAVASQIVIPAKPIPFTLQTMVVVLSGAFLGKKNGMLSQVFYLCLGAVGFPVFAAIPENLFGIARLLGPTGGYLFSFPIGAYLTGLLIEKHKSYFAVSLSMFVGNLVILLIGAVYLDFFFIKNISESLKVGALIFSVWTFIKVFISSAIYHQLKR